MKWIGPFIKSQAASVLGSVADYLTTIFLVSACNTHYLAGNALGNCAGGIAQFILCRQWAFAGASGVLGGQVSRFVLVFAGNILLSAAGVFWLIHFIQLNYILSKTIVSVMLGISYNYYFQRYYVFRPGSAGGNA